MRYAGRVSPVLDAEEDGIPGDFGTYRIRYEDVHGLGPSQREALVALASSLPHAEFARLAGCSTRVAARIAAGDLPGRSTTARVLAGLRRSGGACLVPAVRVCGLDGCGAPVDGRRTYDNPPSEPPMLIDNLLRAGELVVIAGPRGVSKSRLVYNLAGCLASGGGLFLGALAVHRQARTLILQGELDPWASAQRWRAILGDDRPEGIADVFAPVRLRVREVRRTVPGADGAHTEAFVEGELDARVEEAIVEHGFDVLVLDPWATYFGGNENSNDQVEAGLSQLRALALNYGTAIVIVHHLGKANDYRDPEDLWRGASRLADWASTRVTMLPHYSPTAAADAGLMLQQARQCVDLHFLRRHEPLDDFSVHVDEAGVFSRWDAPSGDGGTFRGRIAPDDVGRVAAESGGFRSIADAARQLGVTDRAARRVLDRAVAAGVLVELVSPGVPSKGHRLSDLYAVGGDGT